MLDIYLKMIVAIIKAYICVYACYICMYIYLYKYNIIESIYFYICISICVEFRLQGPQGLRRRSVDLKSLAEYSSTRYDRPRFFPIACQPGAVGMSNRSMGSQTGPAGLSFGIHPYATVACSSSSSIKNMLVIVRVLQ